MLPASLLAAASLANSLEVYGKDVWPAIVQQYSAYTLADLAKARRQIQAVRSQPICGSSHQACSLALLLMRMDLPVRSRSDLPIQPCGSQELRLQMADSHTRHGKSRLGQAAQDMYCLSSRLLL